MKILALDTSTDALSVALSHGDEMLVEHQLAAQQHAGLVLPCVDKLLSKAGVELSSLDGIVFGRGPGSFTGVRIAAAVAQGLAVGAGVGVYGVSSLLATAHAAYQQTGIERMAAVFDARMQEVYWLATEWDATSQLVRPMGDECVFAPLSQGTDQAGQAPTANVQSIAAEVIGGTPIKMAIAGSGATPYASVWTDVFGASVTLLPDAMPHASALITLAKPAIAKDGWLSAEKATPTYLRNRVALTEAQRAAGERL